MENSDDSGMLSINLGGRASDPCFSEFDEVPRSPSSAIVILFSTLSCVLSDSASPRLSRLSSVLNFFVLSEGAHLFFFLLYDRNDSSGD